MRLLLGVLAIIVLVSGVAGCGGAPAEQLADPARQLVPTFTAGPVAGNTPNVSMPTVTSPPAATATPIPSPVPMAPPLVMSGNGGGITTDFDVTGTLLIVQVRHQGARHFSVWLKDAATAENIELLANVAGVHDGSQIARISSGRYFYEVAADGDWQITTNLPSHWPRQDALSFSGNTDTVTPIFVLNAGRANFHVTYQGDRHLGAVLYRVVDGDYIALLANESDPFEVTTAEAVDGGEYLINVSAEGAWAVDVTQ